MPLTFYYSGYYCCVSATSETLCGQLSQALFLPPSPFLSATSLPSPVLLQIFASSIYFCSYVLCTPPLMTLLTASAFFSLC